MAIKIDKSRFDAEELATYEALIAKGSVDPEAAKEDMEDETPAEPPKKTKKAEVDDMDTKKSATPATPEVPEFVTNAIAKSEEFMARVEKKEMTEVAKKYSILGEKPEELGEKLYNLKKSNPEMYDTCISMLDNQVALIEKTGVFGEVGKSAGGAPTGSAVDKADAKAKEIMKADPTMDYTTAIAKAWEDPQLMAEYDSEYYNK